MPSSPTSQLDPRELKRLAELARLDPTLMADEAAGAGLARDLRTILELVGRLDPLSPGEGSSFPPDSPSPDTGAATALRPDECRPSLERDRALAAAPERLGDLFGVTRVLG